MRRIIHPTSERSLSISPKRLFNRRQLLTGSTKLAAGSALALPLGRRAITALAQPASPVASPPLPSGAHVVASGLLNPRFVAIGDDGALYVTEAGLGGDETIYAPATESQDSSAATPAPRLIGNRGLTGQVSKITPDGVVTVIAPHLPSYNGSDGPSGIVFADGQIWLAISGPGANWPIMEPLPHEQSVVQVDPTTGDVTQLADLGAYKRQNSNDPENVDTNTFGLGRGADGALYVADSAGNALFTVNPTSHEISPLATFPDIDVPPAPATPAGASEGTPAPRPPQVQTVPTGIAIGPAGEIYVGELTGWPFIRGLANVLHVQPDGTYTVAGTDLTMVVDVAIGPDGNLYASELSLDYVSQPPAPGRIVRIGENGANDIVVDGLNSPLGIAFDPDGNLYIITNSTSPAGVPPNGQLLRYDAVAATRATSTSG